jgi:class 3 adenylate cyclase/tetratricopeptide (TPR) repeat protein
MKGKKISHYKIFQKLGEGGMGEVFLAEDMKLERKVALKFLPLNMTTDKDARKRFEREARAAAVLNHPNIVTVYEINEFEGQVYIAMEFVEGETLQEKRFPGDKPSLKQNLDESAPSEPIPIEDVIDIALQVCEGLEAAHQAGIIHRDIKLQNIILDKSHRVKILDFGLAKLKGASRITREICRVGTVHYMSPEQARAEEPDQRTDIWSLGVVLYEMVTGNVPFRGDNEQAVIHSILNDSPLPPTEFCPHLPKRLEKIIYKCLRKDRSHRYSSMQPLLSELKRLQESIKGEKEETVVDQKELPVTRKDAERRQATVIVAEISGYKEMLEKFGAEDAAVIMNRCFEMIGPLVEKYGGKLDKIMESTLTILFGLPTAIEDAPKEAINTAIEMRNNLYRFNRENHLEIPLDIHTGINTGMVIAGAIGMDGKRDYSIMGDAVTLAAQLKDLSGKGEIYVGPLTYRYTKKNFDYKELKPVFLEGKTKSSEIFELLSTKEKIYRPELGLEWIYSDMVGRDKELDKLRFHVLKVIHGEGSIVSVIGEAGIGKSRLIAELKRMEDFKKVMLFEGRALSIGKNLSYHPIIECLRSWLSIKEEDSKAELLSRLNTAIAKIYPQGVGEVLPFIATLMGIKLKGKHAQRVKGIEGEAMEKLILKNLGELIIKCAERQPLVYIIEDLHWADISSIELLESLFRLAENQPILFINVLRPNYRETGERLLETNRERYGKIHSDIYLEPLDEKHCEILIQNLVKASGLPTDIRAAIANRAEGNPFFIEEVVRSFFDDGVVEIREGNLCVTEKIDAVKIPETIHDVLMARIDRLDETYKTLLKEASVIGRHFFYKVLAEIDKTTEDIDNKLEYLKMIQLIRERRRLEEIEYLFKHALVQEVAYESILLKKRKELHLNVAKAIESVFSARLHEFYGMLALHYSKGESLEKAEEYLIKAGKEALKTAASNEALSYYQEALRLYLKKTIDSVDHEKIAMLEKNIAIAFFNKGHYVEAVEHFDNVFAYWGKKRPKNKLVVLVKLTVNLLSLIKNLYFPSKKPKKIPGKRDSELINLSEKKAGALSALDTTRFFVESIESLNRLIKLDITKIENGVPIFIAGSSLFSFTRISYRLSRKILNYIKDYVNKKDIRSVIVYNHMEVLHNFYSGNWRKEFEYDEDLVDRNLKSGEFFYTIVFSLIIGLLEIEQGNFSRANRLAKKLDEIGEAYGREIVAARKYTLKTKLLLKSRRLHDALREADEGISLLKRTGQDVYCLAVSGMKVNIQILLNDMEGVQFSLLEVKAMAAHEKTVVASYIGSLLISQFLFDLYMLEQSLDANEQAKIVQFRKEAYHSGKAAVKNSLKFAADRTEVFKLMGLYYWLIGKQKRALIWWNKSIKTGEQLGARSELARTYMEVGKRLQEQKSKHEQLNGIQAQEYLGKARALFQEMELEWDLEQLDKIKWSEESELGE